MAPLVPDGENYNSKFAARAYLEARYAGDCTDWSGYRCALPFYMESYDEFYRKFGNTWDAKTARLCEVGGGPILYTLISAAPHLSEIVFSEFLEDSRKQVEIWKDEDPDAFSWTPYFRYVVNEIEKKPGEEVVAEREAAVRSCIKSICHCDITKHPVVPDHAGEQFQIISTNLCLECVCQTKEEFVASVQRLYNMLRPGGYLLMIISTERTAWTTFVSGEIFQQLYLTFSDVKEAMDTVGLALVMHKRLEIPEKDRHVFNDGTAFEFFVGHKKTED